MAVIPSRPDNSIPLHETWRYVVTPGGVSQQTVEIVRIHKRKVYVKGLDNTTADWVLPVWHFDDVIAEYMIGGFGILTEDALFILSTEDDVLMLGA